MIGLLIVVTLLVGMSLILFGDIIRGFAIGMWRSLQDGMTQARHDRGLAALQQGNTPWSPLEREALGIDDTERFIRETQAILNGLAWDSLTAGREPPPAKEPKEVPKHRSTTTIVHSTDPAIDTVTVRSFDGRIIRAYRQHDHHR